MKKRFSQKYLIENKGCYDTEQVEALPFDSNKEITLEKLFEVLPIRDFTWFFTRKCELTVPQLQRFALECAIVVLPIYENRYPKDTRVRDCIEATKAYLNGGITIKELIEKRNNAADAAYAADAADAAYAADAANAANAANAAADAANAAAYAAYAAAYAAANAAYAAYAANAAYANFKDAIKPFIFLTLKNETK